MASVSCGTVTTEPLFDPKATTIPVLRYLVAVADHAHFGRAAAACSVAQPTLSAQIAQWERRMGVSVFERSGSAASGVKVTAAGERIVAEARATLAALARLEGAVTTGKPPFYAPVRLGVIPTVGPYVLPLLCPAIEAAFPDLDLPIQENQTATLLELLDQGRLDVLLLAVLPGMERGHSIEPLYDEPFLLALPAGHALARAKTVSIQDLAKERLLLLDDGHCLRDQAIDLCRIRDAATRPGADYRATSLETLRQMVALGIGCTVLPALAVDYPNREGAKDPSVAIRPLGAKRDSRTIALVWRAADPRGDAYRQLLPAMRRALPRKLVRVV